MDDYARSYRILGIRPDDSWHELRAAYKSAVRKWHPDRYAADDPEHRQAEERIKEINRAYQELESYYQSHGVLPPLAASRPEDPPIAPPQTAQPAAGPVAATEFSSATGADDDRVPRHRERDAGGYNRWLPWVSAVLLMGLGYVLTGPEDKDPGRETLNTPVAPEPDTIDMPTAAAQAESGKYLTVGLTLDQVYALLGTPTRMDKNHEISEWRYGDAVVFFRAGRVTDWIDSPDHRLAAVNPPAPPAAEAPKTFQLNSTRDEVRAAQGSPLRETDTLWDYGLSQIFFQRDRVVGWHESPLHPLKVRRGPPQSTAPDSASVPN